LNIKQKKLLYFIIGAAISIVLLWFVFRNIDLEKLFVVLQDVNYLWLLPNLFLVLFAIFQRAYRWKFMIEPIKKVRYSNLLSATSIGFMANNVLPFRLGEFVRAYSLSSQDEEISKTASMATIIVERIVFDLIALLLIFGAIVSLSDMIIEPRIIYGSYIAIGIAFFGVIFMLTLSMNSDVASKIIVRYLFFVPESIKNRIQNMVLHFSSGLEFTKKPSLLASVSIHTLLIWFFMGLSNYFVFLAFNFDLTLTTSFVLLVVVSISILVPSAPGYIGVYHGAVVVTLLAYGIPKENAVSFALVLHAAQYIPITTMGFYFLKKEHLSLKSLEAEATEQEL